MSWWIAGSVAHSSRSAGARPTRDEQQLTVALGAGAEPPAGVQSVVTAWTSSRQRWLAMAALERSRLQAWLRWDAQAGRTSFSGRWEGELAAGRRLWQGRAWADDPGLPPWLSLEIAGEPAAASAQQVAEAATAGLELLWQGLSQGGSGWKAALAWKRPWQLDGPWDDPRMGVSIRLERFWRLHGLVPRVGLAVRLPPDRPAVDPVAVLGTELRWPFSGPWIHVLAEAGADLAPSSALPPAPLDHLSPWFATLAARLTPWPSRELLVAGLWPGVDEQGRLSPRPSALLALRLRANQGDAHRWVLMGLLPADRPGPSVSLAWYGSFP